MSIPPKDLRQFYTVQYTVWCTVTKRGVACPVLSTAFKQTLR